MGGFIRRVKYCALHELKPGDTTAAVQARDALWDAQLALYGQIYAMGAVWNELAPRAGGDGA